MTSPVLSIGVVLPMFTGDPRKVMDAALASEDLGYDGVFAFDHFFPPGGSVDRPSLEAFTTLAAVAAATSRVRMGTLVTRAVLRPPGLVAKMASTIDLISGGRLILAAGTGDPIDRPEHEAFGFPNIGPTTRRGHLAEWVEAVGELFRGGAFAGGHHIPPMRGPLLPPPVAGGPPVWLGGLNDDLVRLAGRIANGWNGWGLSLEQFREKAALLQEEAAQGGRRVEATWAGIVLVGETESQAERLREERRRKRMDEPAFTGDPERFVAFLRELAAAGATWGILVLAGPGGRRTLLAERVLPALRH